MDKKEVGNRLKEFGKTKFGKLDLFANALDMSPQSLQSYLSGRSLPGAAIISKLIELGCDTNWLLGIEDHSKAEKVSDVNDKQYEVKDKVIIQQAEEIFKLRQEIKEATEQANALEKRLRELNDQMKKSGVKKLN